jgi:hypothetical protein
MECPHGEYFNFLNGFLSTIEENCKRPLLDSTSPLLPYFKRCLFRVFVSVFATIGVGFSTGTGTAGLFRDIPSDGLS